MPKEAKVEMFINAREKDEIRAAILKDGKLDNYYVERRGSQKVKKGDVYIGKVANVDKGLQAAFVDIGEGPHGFLSLSDTKYPDGGFGKLLRGREPQKKLTGEINISKVLRKGQKILVQVTRESLESKGPSLTSFLSIPGRFLVMIPDTPDKGGISRKIENDKERNRLRNLAKKVKFPAQHGFIFRTASMGCTREEIANDVKYLDRLWGDISKSVKDRKAIMPRSIYREDELLIRLFRDVYSQKIKKVFVDSRTAFDKIVRFLKDLMPTKVKALQLMESREPLFEKFKVEEQIEHIYGREVPLSNGGSIIIEQTEAMISIDVNSGNYHHSKGQEFIAIKTNVLAANEIARQIRLRDIGGLICIDFIDMRDQRNRKDVEMTLAEAIRPDKARINFLPISEFGILEMTRQRNRQNLLSVNFAKCPVCRGTGTVKSPRTMVLEIFRELKHRLARRRGKKKADGQTTIMVHPKLASFLLNENRTRLIDFEREHNQTIHVQASNEVSLNEIKYS